MELFTRCGRCGALVGTTSETFGGASAQCVPCVVASDRCGSEYTVLCQDCMSKLKAWLKGVPEDPKEESDSAERLAADLVSAVENVTATGFCRQQLACGYFGHGGGVACLDREASVHRDECPAYFTDGGHEVCRAAMLDGISRRCEELGIDIGDDADEE